MKNLINLIEANKRASNILPDGSRKEKLNLTIEQHKQRLNEIIQRDRAEIQNNSCRHCKGQGENNGVRCRRCGGLGRHIRHNNIIT